MRSFDAPGGGVVWSLLTLAVITTGIATAAPPLTIVDDGYYITEVADGVPSLVRIDTVIDLRSDAPDEPDPPTPPDPDTPEPPEGISADVAQWAAEIGDPQGAQKYVLILATVRDGAKDGQVTAATAFPILRESAECFLGDKWQPFREKLSDYLTAQWQEGELATTNQLANTLERIRYGVGYSVKESEAISAGEAAEVVAKVNAIMEGDK